MATIKEVKKQIQNANALGIKNLKEKGVGLFSSGIITTYDIMEAISMIIVGGDSGIEYTDITYNEDNTITLTDTDGVVHTMECEYTDGKLTSVKYDGKAVALTYDGDVLVKVGKTEIDMSNAPTSNELLDHTVTFTVDGEPYEVVSVKDGNSINAPATNPQGETTRFDSWDDNNNIPVNFPYQPTGDVVLHANMIESVVAGLYSFYGVNKNDYPVLIVNICYKYWLKIYFAESFTRNGDVVALSGSILTSEKISYKFTSDPGNNFGLVAITCKQKATSVAPVSNDKVVFGLQADQRTYTNTDFGYGAYPPTPIYLVD
jgi:hypothetical protein